MPDDPKKTEKVTDIQVQGGTTLKNESPDSGKLKEEFQYAFLEREIPTFYVNNAQFVRSDMELRIDFGEIQGTTIDEGIAKTLVVPKVRTFMSWPFALRFYAVMKQQIEKHGIDTKEQTARLKEIRDLALKEKEAKEATE